MDFKPSDFLVGVTDFFAVLLPGAIVAAILNRYVSDAVFGLDGFLPRPESGAESWIAFLVSAYLVGHVLFLLGALLDSPLYDPLRRKTVPPESDKAYRRATQVKASILPAGDAAALNTFQWARATLQLQAPAALMEIERYEADSKFFRSLSVALYGLVLFTLGKLAFQPRELQNDVRFWAAVGLGAALALPIWLVVAKLWKDQRNSRRNQEAPEVVSRHESEVAYFWAVVRLIGLILISSAILLLFKDQEQPVILLLVWALAVWRYAERRWKSTKTAYQYAVVLHGQAMPSEQVAAANK